MHWQGMRFTEDEQRIGRRLLIGMRTREIAQDLKMSQGQVRDRMTIMQEKTGTDDLLTLGLYLDRNREWLRDGMKIVRAA